MDLIEATWAAERQSAAEVLRLADGDVTAAADACSSLPKALRMEMLKDWASWEGIPDPTKRGALRDFSRIFSCARFSAHTPASSATSADSGSTPSALRARINLFSELGFDFDASLGCASVDELASLLETASVHDLREAAL